MSTNLNSKVNYTATQWKERAKQDRSNRRNISRAQEFALGLMEFMEVYSIKQKDLAEKMQVSPQQVNKILRAKANLTFDTINKIEDALGVTISTPKIMVKRTYSHAVGTTLQVVHRQASKEIKATLSTPVVTKKNPLLRTTFENMNELLGPVKEN